MTCKSYVNALIYDYLIRNYNDLKDLAILKNILKLSDSSKPIGKLEEIIFSQKKIANLTSQEETTDDEEINENKRKHDADTMFQPLKKLKTDRNAATFSTENEKKNTVSFQDSKVTKNYTLSEVITNQTASKVIDIKSEKPPKLLRLPSNDSDIKTLENNKSDEMSEYSMSSEGDDKDIIFNVSSVNESKQTTGITIQHPSNSSSGDDEDDWRCASTISNTEAPQADHYVNDKNMKDIIKLTHDVSIVAESFKIIVQNILNPKFKANNISSNIARKGNSALSRGYYENQNSIKSIEHKLFDEPIVQEFNTALKNSAEITLSRPTFKSRINSNQSIGFMTTDDENAIILNVKSISQVASHPEINIRANVLPISSPVSSNDNSLISSEPLASKPHTEEIVTRVGEINNVSQTEVIDNSLKPVFKRSKHKPSVHNNIKRIQCSSESSSDSDADVSKSLFS